MGEYREPQLAGGLTSKASLSTRSMDYPSSSHELIVLDLSVAAYVCDYLLEEGTRQLIMSLLLCSSMHLCRPDYSS